MFLIQLLSKNLNLCQSQNQYIWSENFSDIKYLMMWSYVTVLHHNVLKSPMLGGKKTGRDIIRHPDTQDKTNSQK